MPISDEIIELEPVKKNKTKLIIMFIIMGVLLAVAVTFLVLYIIKPSVEAGKGKVYGVVEESSSLCLSGDGDDLTYYAAVDNEYTVYASVSAEGETSKGVIWSMDPANSLIKIADGVDPNDPSRCFYTFKPVDKYADGTTQITLTARAEADPDQVVQIKFFVKKQGTEEVNFTSYWRGSDGDRNKIEGDAITVPYYSDSTNNVEYYVAFEQLGSYDAALGKRIDNITKEEVEGVSSYKVDVESSDSSILEVSQRSINETSNPPRFTFTLKKAGTAKIIITANAHSTFAQPIKKELTVTSVNSSNMDIIEQIFFTKESVGKDTLKTFSGLPLDKLKLRGEFTDTFVMPYGGRYDNILDHIVLYPLTIQYDRATDKLKTEWKNWIKSEQLLFVPTDSKKLNVSVDKNNGNVSLTARAVSDGDDCKLTVQDKIPTSLNTAYEIKVNIVSRNQKTSASLHLPDGKDITQEEINAEHDEYISWKEGDHLAGFEVPQGSETKFKVTYTLDAPNDTELENFVANGFLSKKFVMDFNDKCLTVVQDGDTKPIVSGALTELISPAVKVDKSGTNKFTATATFSVKVNKTQGKDKEPVKNGNYTLTFTKQGVVQKDASDQFNSLSPEWSTTVVFDVEEVATEAGFIQEEEAMKLLVDGNMYNIGKYDVTSAVVKNQSDIYEGTVSITVQNQASDVHFPFDLRKLVKKNDSGKIIVNIPTAESTSFIRVQEDKDNYTLTFKGVNPVNFSEQQAKVYLNVFNNAGKQIAYFTVLIYVIDPINQLSCEDRSVNSIYYDSTTDDGHYSSSVADTVKFKRPLTTPTDNVYSRTDIGLNVNMYYVNGSGGRSKLRHEDGSGVRKFYLTNNTPDDNSDDILAFSYNGNNISQELDFFKYTYEKKTADPAFAFTSKFIIEYCINKSSAYINDVSTKSAPSATRTIQYYRKADKIGIYSDSNYTNQIATDGNDQTFKLTINSGASADLYSAAIINVGTKETPVDIIVPYINNPYTVMEQVYIGVGDNCSIDANHSVAKNSEDKQYYSVTFTANALPNEKTEDIAVWAVSGAKEDCKINIYVQNYMRHVNTVELYSDSGCTNAIDPTTAALEFGRRHDTASTAKPYENTIFLKVIYEDVVGDKKFNSFETVIVDLPTSANKSRFLVNVDGAAEDIVGNNIILSNNNDDDLQTVSTYRIYALVIKAVAEDDAAKGVYQTVEMKSDADKLTVKKNSDKTNAIASLGVNAVAELSSIGLNTVSCDGNVSSVTSGSGDASVTTITFALKNENDSPTATLNLIGHTFAFHDGYKGLGYNKANISGSANPVDGLLISVNIPNNTVDITIDDKKLKTLSEELIITFRDGRTNREYTIKLRVVVTMDIFQLSTSAVTLNGNAFATTGVKDGSFITVGGNKPQLTVLFNGDNNTIVPTADLKNKVTAELLVKDGTSYTATNDITANGIDSSGNITLNIPNSLLKSVKTVNGKELEYWVRVKYTPTGGTTVYSDPVRVDFTTTAQGIRLASTGNIALTDGVNGKEANVVVVSNSSAFTIAAETYNLGTLATEDATETTTGIKYELFDDDGYTNASNVATVSNNGVINFTQPHSSGKGTVYLKISYTDGNGNVSAPIKVAVSYTVAIADVNYKDGLSDTITLYKNGSSNYTYIDNISNHLEVTTNFSNVQTQTLTITLKAGASDIYSVSGLTVKPVKEGDSAGSLTLDITDGTVVNGVQTVITKTFNVKVVNLANALTLNPTSAEINLADSDNSVSFTPTVNNTYAELNASYSATAESNRVNVADPDAIPTDLSFDKTKFTAESDYGDYTVNANATYRLNDGYGVYSVNSSDKQSIVVTKPFKLTAKGEYTPTFVIKHNGTETKIIDKETDITNINDDSFTVDVTNKKSDSNFTYSVTANNNIVTFDGSDPLMFKFTENKAGSVTFTVTAAGYGKTYTSDYVTYTFVYGKGATGSLEMSTDGGAYSAFTATTDPVYIDFTTDARKFKYTVDVSAIGSNIAESDIIIDYSGNVTAGELTFVKDSSNIIKSAYMEFTAAKATTFKVSGSVRANGSTYYTETYTLDLKAYDPIFGLAVTPTTEEITPTTTTGGAYNTASLSISQTETHFKGAYSVTYSIVGGADKATVDNNGVITVNNNLTVTSDTAITVRATINVTSGVHTGAVYTIDKLITIKGVVLPEVNWKTSSVTADAGTTVTLSDKFDFVNKADNYTYGTPVYSYEITSSNGLTENTDYTFNTSTGDLVIKKNTNTEAGGLITVKVKATVNGSINNGQTVTSGTFDIVINPTLKANEMHVYGGKGTTDISGAVVVNGKDGGAFIHADDKKVVTFAFENPAEAVDGIRFDGGNIILTENFAEKKTMKLNATVVMTSGAYTGKTFTVPVTVHVLGAVLNSATAAWNETAKSYGAIAAETLVPSLETSQTISSIEVSDNAFFAVTDNNTVSPKITVNKDANVSGGDNQKSELAVTLKVTLNNEHIYFVSGNINVNPITTESEAQRVNADDTKTPVAAGSTVYLEAGEKLSLVLSEKHGLSVSDLTIGNALTDGILTGGVSGNTVTFTAGRAAENVTYNIKLSFKSSGANTAFEFTVIVRIAPDENAFKVTNIETTHLYQYGSDRTVESIWTPTATMKDFMTPESVFVTSNYTPSSITFANTAINTYGYSSLTGVEQKQSFIVQITVPARYIRTYNITLQYTGQNADGSTKTVAVNYIIKVERSITATFDLQGGEGSIASQSIGYNDSTKIFNRPADPTRVGYKFVDWYTEKEGGEKYSFGVETKSVNLYARWANAEVTATFNANGGTLSSFEESKTVILGGTYGVLPNPTRVGYTFGGWYTAVSGGSKVESTTTVELTDTETSAKQKTLYASWTRNNYTVTFDANGGKIGTENIYKKEDVPFDTAFDATWASPSYVDDVYTFGGWYTLPVGGDRLTDSDKIKDNITVYAHWNAKEYNNGVTLNSNYGETPTTKTITVTYGSTYGDALTDPAARTGYDFVGWYTAKNGGDHITRDTIVSSDANTLTLYAHWQAKTYIVTLIDGSSEQKITVTYDSPYGNDLVDLSQPGQKFLGWYATKAENGTLSDKVKKSDTVKLTADQILYAGWEYEEYTVTLVNGSEISEITVTLNQSWFGPDGLTELTKAGYRFDGWYSDKNYASGTKINDGDTVREVPSSGYKLYAKWTALPYTVTLNDPLNAENRSSITVTYGETFGHGTDGTNGLKPLTKTGYDFVGWFTDNTYSTKVDPTDTVSVLSDGYTLHALWSAKTVTLNYNYTGANPASEAVEVTYGSTYSALTSPTRTGYEFGGWYKTKAADGTLSDKVEKFDTVGVISDGYTLYAEWTAKTYTVTLVDGSDIRQITVTYGSAYGDTLTTPTRTGYEFGWYTAQNGGTLVTEETVVSTASNHILYAKWTAITYTATLDENYGENPSTTEKTVTYGSAYGNALTTPTRTGYTFVGWYTEQNGGTLVTKETVVSTASNHILYAKWTNTYTVTIDLNYDGAPAATTITVTYGSTYGSALADPTTAPTGYDFGGWYTDKACSDGNSVTSSSNVNTARDHTLYAKWTVSKYKVTFDANDGTIGNDSTVTTFDKTDIPYGTAFNSEWFTQTVSRFGYDFDGWYTDATNGDKVTSATAITGNITVYAHWKEKSVTVVYIDNGTTIVATKLFGENLGTRTLAGYEFKGWYTTAGADGIEVVTVNSENYLTVYARWTANTYTVTLNENYGDTPATSEITVTYDSTYGEDLADPTAREGYTFDGWYKTKAEDGTLSDKVEKTDTVKLTGNCTLYAKWTEIPPVTPAP